MRVYGRIVPSRGSAGQQMVPKEPVGPVATFTPWNFPVTQIDASSALHWRRVARFYASS